MNSIPQFLINETNKIIKNITFLSVFNERLYTTKKMFLIQYLNIKHLLH